MIEIETERGSDGMGVANAKGGLIFIEQYMMENTGETQTLSTDDLIPPRAKRGRPKKKPDYDLEQNINSLLATAVSLFEVPYDDRVERPEDAPTITHVAEKMNTSRMRARKLLITAGYYSTETSRKIQELYEQGSSIQEIGERLNLGRSAVHNVLPYKKGVYKLPDPTLNAEQCQQFQRRKKACENLRAHLDEDQCQQLSELVNIITITKMIIF